MEADIYAPGAPHLSDYIDGALGPDTAFDTTHGIHADGVSPHHRLTARRMAHPPVPHPQHSDNVSQKRR